MPYRRSAAPDDDESRSSLCENADDGVHYHEAPAAVYSRIQANDPELVSLTVCPYDPPPSPVEWIALGEAIGRNSRLEVLHLIMDGVNYAEDEMATPTNLEAFCEGVSANKSLRQISLYDFDLGRARLDALAPFFESNVNLVRLGLEECSLQLRDIQVLSESFRRRSNPESIKYITLSDPCITDEWVQDIVDLCNLCPQLKELDLSYSRIGDQGCNGLSLLLEDPESMLKSLFLRGSSVGNEGALIFARAIRNNDKLERLGLEIGRNGGVTARGWDAILGIQRGTSINETYLSNHSLRCLWKYTSWGDVTSPAYYNLDLPDGLRFCLEANNEKNKAIAARKKIFHFHFSGKFDLSPFNTMDMGILPYVLGWIGEEDCRSDGISRVSVFFRILRGFPDLCSFPSSERKIRRRLEIEVSALKSDKAKLEQRLEQKETVITDLKEENETMKRRIEQLMLENEASRSTKRLKHKS